MWHNRLNHQKSFWKAPEHPYRLKDAVRLFPPIELGEGYEDGFILDGSCLLTAKKIVIKNTHQDPEQGFGRLVFLFHLDGCRLIDVPGVARFQLNVPSFVAYFHPEGIAKVNAWSRPSFYTCVSVGFDKAHPPEAIRSCFPTILETMARSPQSKAGFLWFERPLDPAMQQIAGQILSPEIHKHLIPHFLSIKSNEMICLSADRILKHSLNDDICNVYSRKSYVVKQYLDNHLQDNISIESLSRKVGLSEFSLSKAFRDNFGCSISDYRTSIRMAQAARMLASTTVSMKRIAFEVGYSHVSNFSIAFKRRFGITPGQARAKATGLDAGPSPLSPDSGDQPSLR